MAKNKSLKKTKLSKKTQSLKKPKTKVAKKSLLQKKKAKKSLTTSETCYYCLETYNPKVGHDCIPLTERDLLAPLNEDLQDAFAKLKSLALEFGEQKIYNNARAIMFSRRVCYMFVRIKKTYLELCFFLPRKLQDPLIFRTQGVSKTKFSHTFKLIHPDQLEEPLSDWLREAFEYSI